MSRRGPLAVAVVALAACTLAAARAGANPVDAFGFTPRAAAMGGAVTADAEDSSANYYNPAGLVRGRSLRVDIGYRSASPSLRMNGRDARVDSARGFQLGLVAPAAFGSFRFAIGVAVALPDQRFFRARSTAYDTPRFVYYDNRMQRIWLSANVAVEILPGLSVGGGVTFMSRTQGSVDLTGLVAFSDAEESALVSKLDVGLFAVRYPQLGARWDATRWLSVGVSYRHAYTLELDQVFRIQGNVGNPGVKPLVENGFFETHTDVLDLFQPWQLTGGASVKVSPRVRVSFDATYARWSAFPAAHVLALRLDLKAWNDRVHLSPSRTYPAPGFSDILIPRVGVELRALDRGRYALQVRAGYSYEPTPVPAQMDESNLIDCDKHTVSAGLGLDIGGLAPVLGGGLSVDGNVGATLLAPRDNRKTDPRDRVGDTRGEGSILELGLMLRTRF